MLDPRGSGQAHLSQGTPVRVHLAPDALRVLPWEQLAEGTDGSEFEPEHLLAG